jgi:RNA polymerase sigma factor (sigma-70 family)
MAIAEYIGVTDELTLHKALMRRAPDIRFYMDLKTPPNLRSVIAVEDVLQEVWIAAFQGLPSFRPEGPDALDRWLTTIVQRILINTIKAAQATRRGGHCGADPQDKVDRSSSMLNLFSEVASPSRTPSSEAAAVEAVHSVQIALASLPEDRRQVVWLRYIKGKTNDEIAMALKKTRTAVKSLLTHGLRDLKERLGTATKFLSYSSSCT